MLTYGIVFDKNVCLIALFMYYSLDYVARL